MAPHIHLQFSHSFNKHTLSTYSLLDTVLSSGSIIMNKIRKVVFRKCFQSNNIWEESLKNIIRRVKELNIDKRKYNLFLTELLKVVFWQIQSGIPTYLTFFFNFETLYNFKWDSIMLAFRILPYILKYNLGWIISYTLSIPGTPLNTEST